MATHCFAGNCARGMTMAALHNGGGTGIGNAINGGFGLVLDGSQRVDDTIRSAISWDVMGGVARRSWARNTNAMAVSQAFNQSNQGVGHITIPFVAEDGMVEKLVAEKLKEST
jgi:urocanate hydratase